LLQQLTHSAYRTGLDAVGDIAIHGQVSGKTLIRAISTLGRDTSRGQNYHQRCTMGSSRLHAPQDRARSIVGACVDLRMAKVPGPP
jgi:hypothetical protein